MAFNLQEAIRLRYFSQIFGFPYSGPTADVAASNNVTEYVLDPNGNVMPSLKLSGNVRGHFDILNPNGLTVGGQIATAGTPTVTPTGGSGTSWGYKIVARASNGTAAGSAEGTTSTGASTLSQTAYNTITWTAVSGAISYDIYRSTAGGASPTTTGKIGNVLATAALSFVDNNIAGDSTTVPTTNTTGTFGAYGTYDINVIGLASPQGLTVTPTGTAGGTTYGYRISAVTLQGTENPCAEVQTTTGNATLSSTNFNALAWNAVPGAISYNVYRSTGAGSFTAGTLGNVPVTKALTFSYNDVGAARTSATVTTTNGTGSIKASGGIALAGGTTTFAATPNYIATETGSNNAIAGALVDSSGNNVPLAAGLVVTVKLAHTLQAGANTFVLNGTSKNIKSHFNSANNIATVYAATGVITMIYDGTQWLDMSE